MVKVARQRGCRFLDLRLDVVSAVRHLRSEVVNAVGHPRLDLVNVVCQSLGLPGHRVLRVVERCHAAGLGRPRHRLGRASASLPRVGHARHRLPRRRLRPRFPQTPPVGLELEVSSQSAYGKLSSFSFCWDRFYILSSGVPFSRRCLIFEVLSVWLKSRRKFQCDTVFAVILVPVICWDRDFEKPRKFRKPRECAFPPLQNRTGRVDTVAYLPSRQGYRPRSGQAPGQAPSQGVWKGVR